MDARRNQVYTGIYEFKNNRLHVLEPQMAVSIKEIADNHFSGNNANEHISVIDNRNKVLVHGFRKNTV